MNIILGVYNGYSSLKTEKGGIYYFMKSLRKYTSCKVVLFCEKKNVFDALISFSKEMDVELYTEFEVKYPMMYYRFELYKEYLKDLVVDKILLTDMDDVIFQEDPFQIQVEEMYFALEGNLLSDTNMSSLENMYWISQIPVYQNYDCYQNAPVVCAGTILGTYKGIMKYLEFYVEIQHKRVVNDQGLLNVYVYNYLHKKTCFPYTKSKILTLDRIPFHTLSIENGIVNENRETYSILHQINRCNLPFMLSLV
jgi:hypothetical protein